MASRPMFLIECGYAKHGEAVRALINTAITTSTVVYDYQPRSLASIETWFNRKTAQNLPVLGLVDQQGELLGFASYDPFRAALPAYKYALEHSLYVDQRYRRQGVATRLLQALIERAGAQQYHTLVGVIDTANIASIALHQQLGFAHAGTLQQVGFKFGRWLDVHFYQKLLATPDQPDEG